jgi:hypothetical protein
MKKLLGKPDIEDTLKRLDKLTQEEVSDGNGSTRSTPEDHSRRR